MVSVLLLNASFEPLAVISTRRAVSLVLRGRVEGVSGEVVTVHGASQTFTIPTVIRLRRYVNVPRRGARWSRRGVLRRDGYRCVYCGARAGDLQGGRVLTRGDFTVDHLVPRSRGGKSTWSNTACACRACNQRKRDRTPREAGMKLLWEPKTPRTSYLVVSGEVPASWKVYLRL